MRLPGKSVQLKKRNALRIVGQDTLVFKVEQRKSVPEKTIKQQQNDNDDGEQWKNVTDCFNQNSLTISESRSLSFTQIGIKYRKLDAYKLDGWAGPTKIIPETWQLRFPIKGRVPKVIRNTQVFLLQYHTTIATDQLALQSCCTMKNHQIKWRLTKKKPDPLVLQSCCTNKKSASCSMLCSLHQLQILDSLVHLTDIT